MNTSREPGSVEPEVLAYYRRNWERIVHCYDTDSEGYPIDPAWYRRRLYNEFLDREAPQHVLDVGCGAGQTVFDVLSRGAQGEGIEPVPELVAAGQALLESNGHPPGAIRQGDLSDLPNVPAASYDCVALLSVLPAIPFAAWETAHKNIAACIRPGGWMVAAYRNQLFDLYTFNSITLDFYNEVLWDRSAIGRDPDEDALNGLRSLITHPDEPGRFHTSAPDKAFGRLERPKSNPLTLARYLAPFGLKVERIRFCHFHFVPPLLDAQVKDLKSANHQLELTLSDDWRGNFMAAMAFVEARRV